MSEELDAKNVSIADILSGIAYPTETVDVYMDESTAYEISKVNAELSVKTRKGLDTSEEESKLDDLVKKGASSLRTIHLQGVSRHDRQNIIRTVMEDHPQKTDFMGRVQPDMEADERYTNLLWAAMIQKIESPAGELSPVSEADVKTLRGAAPEPALELINKAVAALTEGAKSGFETLAQEHNFLSQR